MHRKNLRLPGLVAVATLLAAGLAALGLAQGPLHAAAPTTPLASPTLRSSATPRPRATVVPLPKAATATRSGAPTLPIELEVPFVGGAWPVGVFVLGTSEASPKKANLELGVLNEADLPLTIAAAGQYREAVSLYSEGNWKGLFFVGMRTAAGQDLLPSGGGGAADLPPGVWSQMHLEVNLPEGDRLAELRAGLSRDRMAAYPIEAAQLTPAGQPWAAAGAAPTPLAIDATPMPTKS